MASAIKLLATQMEAMEASFLTIFFEAANKIANLTESKLFFLMESSDGIRKIGGHSELKLAFETGGLLHRSGDVLLDEDEGINITTSGIEGYPDSNGSHSAQSKKRKSSDSIENQADSTAKSRRQEIDDLVVTAIKKEDCDGDPTDRGDDLIELEFTDDELEKSRASFFKEKDAELEVSSFSARPGTSKSFAKSAKGKRDSKSVCPSSGIISRMCPCCLGPGWVKVDKHPGRSEVWEHFVRRSEPTALESQCLTCHKVFTGAVTTTLRYHMEKVHGVSVAKKPPSYVPKKDDNSA